MQKKGKQTNKQTTNNNKKVIKRQHSRRARRIEMMCVDVQQGAVKKLDEARNYAEDEGKKKKH